MAEEYGSMMLNPGLPGARESSDSDDASSLRRPAKRCRPEQSDHWSSGDALPRASGRRLLPPGSFERVRPDGTPAAMAGGGGGSAEPRLFEFLATTAGGTRREGFVARELFRKELTPSDVGKLNRLVIPKKHAVRHFPAVEAAGGKGSPAGSGRMGGDGLGGTAEGIMLEFDDARGGRRWEFRYCYWKSSQSFVFTKGWNRFVKTKGLREKDAVAFYRCRDGGGLRAPFCMIEAIQGGGADRCGGEAAPAGLGGGGVGWEGEGTGLGAGFDGRGGGATVAGLLFGEGSLGVRHDLGSAESVGSCREEKSFVLFGVQIKGTFGC